MISKTSQRPRPARTQGFSLIELMVAAVILIQLLLGTAQLLILAQQLSMRYRDHLSTICMISDRVEYFRSLAFEDPELNPGEASARLKDTDSGHEYVLQWTVRSLSPSLKSLELTCFPLHFPHRRTTTSLYLSRDVGF